MNLEKCFFLFLILWFFLWQIRFDENEHNFFPIYWWTPFAVIFGLEIGRGNASEKDCVYISIIETSCPNHHLKSFST
jgi:hypothetical protein